MALTLTLPQKTQSSKNGSTKKMLENIPDFAVFPGQLLSVLFVGLHFVYAFTT